MQNQAYLNLALIILASLTFIPFGRLLKVKGVFAQIFVGLSASGLLVAILANFCAGLIRPVVIALVLTGLVMLVRNYKGLGVKENRWLYALLLIVGVVFLLLNNPITLFIKDKTLLFNTHYSYYSTTPMEMLNAHYFSRLKVAQFLPFSWGRYHFFNSSVQASVQALVPHPDLFSYFYAQLVLSILVVLTILEGLFLRYRLTLKTIIISALWLIIGFSAFANSISWNLVTSGTFSVGAMVLLVLSLFHKEKKSFVLYSIILGASAFRLMPVAIVALILLAIHEYYSDEAGSPLAKIRALIKSVIPSSYYLLMYIAFFVYALATIVSAKASSGSELNIANVRNFFSEGWVYPLLSYKIIGLTDHLLGKNVFLKYAFDGYANSAINHRALALSLLVFALVLLTLVSKSTYMFFKQRGGFLASIPLFLILIVALYFSSAELKSLFTLTIPYLVINLSLIFQVNKGHKDQNNFLIFYLWLFAIALILQTSPLSVEVKSPILYIVCDVASWALLGVFLLSRITRWWHILLITALAILLIPIFKLHFKNILVIQPSVDVAIDRPLDKNFSRKDFIDGSTNNCRFNFDDPMTVDAYSALIGCNLNSKTENNKFMSHGFINQE